MTAIARPAPGHIWTPDTFWDLVENDRGGIALFHGDDEISRGELADRVRERARELGAGRLVLLAGGNNLELVVTYLAALRAGSPVLLTGDDPAALTSLVEIYDPDVVVRTGAGRFQLEHRHADPVHDLHHDLALLLSTSGSTGSPKLVRLSHTNLSSNAAAITGYLNLGRDDVGITSLPLHYCYGLSVLSAHLHAGAPLVLTDTSVVDPCFWSAVHQHRVTNIAGVPYTFELLETVGLERLGTSSVRFCTQAGGRMDPERVSRIARAGRDLGFELFVMYGQTEATARMAYLPPDLAEDRPEAIGIPIPGGDIDIEPLPAEEADAFPEGAGEIVYRGPNVMMGYATAPSELSRGPELDALHTGDVARRAEDGLLEVVGRRSRFVKVYGLRVDLDRLEQLLARHGLEAICAGDDTALAVGTTDDHPDAVASLVAELTGIPARLVATTRLEALPLTARGKPDRSGLSALLAGRPDGARGPDGGEPEAGDASRSVGVAGIYRRVIGRDDVRGDDTFVSAGGDSLSYVEAALWLEEELGTLPEDWHLRTVNELESLARSRDRRRAWRRTETGVLLRAAAVVLVVGNHMDLYRVPGGAHVLLAVAGFNLARFGLDRATASSPTRLSWWRERLRPIARVAVPTSLWILVTLVVAGGTSLGAALLVNNYLGSPGLEDERWRYWFIEVLVQSLLATTLLLAVPAVRRLDRHRPFLLPVLLLGPALALRFAQPVLDNSPRFAFRTHNVVWIFLLGWAASRAKTIPQKALVSALTVVGCAGFFGEPLRDGVLAGGILLLTWIDRVAVPRVAARPVAAVAAASMWIYLTHYDVFPPLQRNLPDALALVLTVGVGIAAAQLADAVPRSAASVNQRVKRFRSRPRRTFAGPAPA